MKSGSGILAHLVFVTAILFLTLCYAPPIFSGDYDTARNYLSTIAATLATILALCISIVLVAMQMTASKYSPRVLDFFIRLPFNASLLSLYLFTIFHCIYILSKVDQAQNGMLPLWLDRAMSADLFLLGCCLIALISYLFAILRLMKPETILLTIEKEYLSCYQRGVYQEAVNKLEQLADIGKRSLADLDTMTGHLCVVRLAHVLGETRVPTEFGSPVLWYHKKVIRLLLSLASIAYEKREVTVSSSVLDELETIGHRYVEAGSIPGVALLSESYQWIITNNLMGTQQQDVIRRVLDLLFELVCGILKNKGKEESTEAFQFVEEAVRALHLLGLKLVQTESYGATLVAEMFLTARFSDVVHNIYARTSRRKWAEEVAFRCAMGYLTLFSSLLEHLKPSDFILVTTWIRSLLLVEQPAKERYVSQFYKGLTILVMAICIQEGRRDLFVIALRSIGNYFSPQVSWFNELLERRLQIRKFFHYQEPEPFLRQVYEVWTAYYGVAGNRPAPAKAILNAVAEDPLRKQKVIDNWPELFQTAE